MVTTTKATQCPVAPKRGWILVADHSPGEEIRDSGLIIPRGAVEHVRRARVVALGKNPIDFRTGVEHKWDYAEGDVLVLSDQASSAWLPMEFNGQKVALINEAHIIGLWVGE